MEKKIVDAREYLSLLRELTQQGKEVSLLITGNSMSPFLVHERDRICFKKPDTPLKKGDMVFFQRRDGAFVMHRICRVRPEGYYLVGDAQTWIEGPITPEQIFARVTKIQRKGRQIGPENGIWKFFQYVWIRIIPLRPFLVRFYTRIVK